nr:MAG TPA: hypothetical protein [Caudoviricetes sp.]
MMIYRRVTGGNDLRGFWRTTPAELAAWAEAITGEQIDDEAAGLEEVEEDED